MFARYETGDSRFRFRRMRTLLHKRKQRIMADRRATSEKLPTSTMSTRKRKKQESDTKRGITRISIGDQFDRWMAVKNEITASRHAEVAKYLLDL